MENYKISLSNQLQSIINHIKWVTNDLTNNPYELGMLKAAATILKVVAESLSESSEPKD